MCDGEPMELSFGVVSVVGPGIDVLDGVNVLQLEGVIRGGFWEFSSHEFQWRIVHQKCIRLVCEKLTICPHGRYIVGNVFSFAF